MGWIILVWGLNFQAATFVNATVKSVLNAGSAVRRQWTLMGRDSILVKLRLVHPIPKRV